MPSTPDGSAGAAGEARSELQGGAGDAFAGIEGCEQGEAEVFVRGAAESAEVVVAAGPDEMPVKEVTRAVEGGLHMAFPEVTALDDGVDGLEDVGGVEFEGAGDEESRESAGVGIVAGIVDETAGGVDGECLGV